MERFEQEPAECGKGQRIGQYVDQTVVTGKDGTMKVKNLNPGTYTVTELTENRYEPQKEQKVKVTGGENTKVEFSNMRQRTINLKNRLYSS